MHVGRICVLIKMGMDGEAAGGIGEAVLGPERFSAPLPRSIVG